MNFEILYKDEPYTVTCNIFLGEADIIVNKNIKTKNFFGGEKIKSELIGSGKIIIENAKPNLTPDNFVIDNRERVQDMITRIIEIKDKDLNKYRMLINCSDDVESLYSEPEID